MISKIIKILTKYLNLLLRYLEKPEKDKVLIMENRQRLDLTEWVIHFVHDRKPADNPSGLYEDYIMFYDEFEQENSDDENGDKRVLTEDDFRLYDYYDENGDGHFIHDAYIENEYEIDEEALGYEVLKKILHDGFIHSGWSLRNMKPSIYGPKSAVCFTEMPLYALLDYAKVRGRKSGYVGNYGIAFKRNELFAAGARPVIYGLTGDFKETDVDENGVFQGRLMDASCGIGKQEQYRYVSTMLHKKKGVTIDWTHEREWRWALPDGRYGVPGLPFLLAEGYADFFSEVIIIVCTDEEQDDLLMHLKNLYDAGCRNTGYEYKIKMISSAKVLSLETIANTSDIDTHTMKIEDLPMKQMRIIPEFNVSPKLIEKARKAIVEANGISVRSVEEYLRKNPSFDEQKGYWGFAHVCTNSISEVTQALQDAGFAKAYSSGDYYINVDEYRTCNLELLEIGAQAAAEYLTKALGQYFFVKSRLD